MIERARLLFLGAVVTSLLSSCSTFASGGPCDPADASIGDAEFKVEVTNYLSAKPGTQSLIIMPPTGGTNRIDRSYAKQFCEAGFDVTIMNSWTADTGKSTDLEIHQGFYTRMLKAVDMTLATIPSRFVGILGTSLGGLYAAVAASKIERLDAVFLIVAGAPIANVIVTSDQAAMRKLAEDRRKRFGIGDDTDYEAKLSKKFQLEPMAQPPLAKKKDYGVVIATEDTTVPTKNQEILRDFLKPRKEIKLSNAHFWAIVNTWLHHDDEIVEFFQESARRANVR